MSAAPCRPGPALTAARPGEGVPADNARASSAEHLADASRYARLLEAGSRLGLAALVLSFSAYVSGLLPAHVSLDRLPGLWGLPVSTYLRQTGTPTGWGWLALAHRGDLSNLVGIAVLAGCSIPPLLGLIPLFLRRRDYIFASICALVAAVLLLAASGMVDVGH